MAVWNSNTQCSYSETESTFCFAVDFVVGLFEAAVTVSSIKHVSFRDNSVIIL